MHSVAERAANTRLRAPWLLALPGVVLAPMGARPGVCGHTCLRQPGLRGVGPLFLPVGSGRAEPCTQLWFQVGSMDGDTASNGRGAILTCSAHVSVLTLEDSLAWLLGNLWLRPPADSVPFSFQATCGLDLRLTPSPSPSGHLWLRPPADSLPFSPALLDRADFPSAFLYHH